MPRSQPPPDPDTGPIAEFAYALWQLRQSAGDPTFREMNQRAHIAHTSLSRASKGEAFPTWAVTRGYVRACGGDEDEWEQRYKDAAKKVESAKRAAVATGMPPIRTESVPVPGERTHQPPSDSSQDAVLETGAGRRQGAHRRAAKRPAVQLWRTLRANIHLRPNSCWIYLHVIMLIILAASGIGLSLHTYLIHSR